MNHSHPESRTETASPISIPVSRQPAGAAAFALQTAVLPSVNNQLLCQMCCEAGGADCARGLPGCVCRT